MSFIRPEVRSGLWRWRETLAGLLVGGFGLWGAIGSEGAAEMLGYAFTVAGAVLTFAGIQRARFRIGSDGPGLVEVTEGQVTYFGPNDGGTIAVNDIALVELDPKARPHASWLLTENGQPPLAIPTTAQGADALFDVFAALDGIRTERMLAELKKSPSKRVVIWQSPKPLSHAVAIPSALH
ncbi:hypothetical protein [Frigidibacter sp. ROC022]|uniref:hypothetical protein n=1 Tax=Frigidibacter sp. ROC022 TaxID=2971796 RepID=UPI00215AF20C|nr:hypothetical protein [Frigidibacter sp. ROC022]MCR8726611.1 hypothetical protein [Frigidibacter sp. ROC022]